MRKILIVDDDLNILEAIARSLRLAGYAVETVQRASDALEMLEFFKATGIDLVVTDYNMPGGMNGLELAKEIRTRNFTMPIILFTASSIDEEYAKSTGISEIFSKRDFTPVLEYLEKFGKGVKDG